MVSLLWEMEIGIVKNMGNVDSFLYEYVCVVREILRVLFAV